MATNNRLIWKTLGIGAVAAMSGAIGLVLVEPGLAQSGFSTVKKLDGSWSGGGTVKPLSGGSEHINCKVKYNVKVSNFTQQIDCSGPKTKFDIDGDLNLQGTNIEGKWTDTVRGYTGGASGSVEAGKINMRIEGPDFTGRMDIAVSGNSQTVSVTQYDVKSKGYKHVADIKLHR